MTDLRQAAQQALEALTIADNIALVGAAYTPKSIDLGLRKIRDSATALSTALEQPEQEPAAQWEHTSASFDEWWDGDYDDLANPYHTGTPAYWAWAGWVAAQRPWVGLTPEEVLDLFDRNNVYGSKWIEFARTVEAKLKERNNG
jgi:hypothetical protein